MNSLKISESQFGILLWIILFCFQDLLVNISSIFSYIDELPLLLLICTGIFRFGKKGKLHISKSERKFYVALILFICTGLLSNLIYNYQSTNLVLIDLLTNLKFWGAIGYFTLFLKTRSLDRNSVINIAKIISMIILCLFIFRSYV